MKKRSWSLAKVQPLLALGRGPRAFLLHKRIGRKIGRISGVRRESILCLGGMTKTFCVHILKPLNQPLHGQCLPWWYIPPLRYIVPYVNAGNIYPSLAFFQSFQIKTSYSTISCFSSNPITTFHSSTNTLSSPSTMIPRSPNRNARNAIKLLSRSQVKLPHPLLSLPMLLTSLGN